jgi:DNA-binding GntR family transcriptional regulator
MGCPAGRFTLPKKRGASDNAQYSVSFRQNPQINMPTATTKERYSQKLSQQICELLKKDIIECNLEPGQLLEGVAISERYQIGRTPFREACQRLETAGLVEIVPHRGAFVASFSHRNISDLFELRMVVEPEVAALAAQRSAGSSLAALESNIAEWEGLTQSTEPPGIPDINWNSKNFHLEVARLTQNKELVNVVEAIQDKLMRIMIFTARRSPHNFPFNAIHPEILEAIRKGNASEAKERMIRDIKIAWDWVRDFGG